MCAELVRPKESVKQVSFNMVHGIIRMAYSMYIENESEMRRENTVQGTGVGTKGNQAGFYRTGHQGSEQEARKGLNLRVEWKQGMMGREEGK